MYLVHHPVILIGVLTLFEDDWEAWKFLESRGYTMNKGVITYRPEKSKNMSEDEEEAICYLVGEWDWAYE